LRFAEELDDLAQFLLGFIHAGDVLEGHLLLLHGEQARSALAEAEGLVSAGLHLADHDEPQCAEKNEWREVQQPRRPSASLRFANVYVHALFTQGLIHVRIVGGDCGLETVSVGVLAVHFGAGDRDFLDLGLVNVGHELRERNVGFLGGVSAGGDDLPQQHAAEDDNQPKNDRLDR
jgi:hypothetical protein